jgi:hypothetical protein
VAVRPLPTELQFLAVINQENEQQKSFLFLLP